MGLLFGDFNKESLFKAPPKESKAQKRKRDQQVWFASQLNKKRGN